MKVTLYNSSNKTKTFTLYMLPSSNGTPVLFKFKVKEQDDTDNAFIKNLNAQKNAYSDKIIDMQRYILGPEERAWEGNYSVMHNGMKEYIGGYKLNNTIKSFDVKPKGKEVIEYMYVLATQTNSHMWHIWEIKDK